MSPVWSTNAGRVGRARMAAIVSRRVASGSGLAGFLKPMWLSLTWTKLRPPAAADVADRADDSRAEAGKPPPRVQTTPAPAHARHLSAPPAIDGVPRGRDVGMI
jgi:hypothetical protein